MRYSKHIFICTNERPPDHPRGSCKNCGGEEIRTQFKQALKERRLHGTMRANSASCLDACEYGAAIVVYPDNVWYGGVTLGDIDEIIESHLIGGQPVQRLRIPNKRYTPETELPLEAEDVTNTD